MGIGYNKQKYEAGFHIATKTFLENIVSQTMNLTSAHAQNIKIVAEATNGSVVIKDVHLKQEMMLQMYSLNEVNNKEFNVENLKSALDAQREKMFDGLFGPNGVMIGYSDSQEKIEMEVINELVTKTSLTSLTQIKMLADQSVEISARIKESGSIEISNVAVEQTQVAVIQGVTRMIAEKTQQVISDSNLKGQVSEQQKGLFTLISDLGEIFNNPYAAIAIIIILVITIGGGIYLRGHGEPEENESEDSSESGEPETKPEEDAPEKQPAADSAQEKKLAAAQAKKLVEKNAVGIVAES